MKNLVLTSLLLSLTGCSTVTLQKQLNFKPYQDPAVEMCSGPAAKQKYSFLIRSYSEVPHGVDASSVVEQMDNASASANWVATNFVKILLTRYLTPTKPISSRAVMETSDLWYVETDITDLTHGILGADDKTRISMAWSSDYTFYLWSTSRLGLAPTKEWSKQINFDRSSEEGYCNEFLKYYHGPHGGTSCHTYAPPTGMLAFAGATGFPAAEFIDSHYFVASESEKVQLCNAAGLQADCFDFSSDDKIAAMREAFETNKSVRNKFLFLSHSKFTALEYDKLRSDRSIILDWQSALIKDLALMSSVKVSKKISGNFTDYRIDWDPSAFCKYGRPKSELYTH